MEYLLNLSILAYIPFFKIVYENKVMFKAIILTNVFLKLPFEYYWIAGTSIASKVWKRDLKTVANSSAPRPTYSSNVNTSHVVVKIREHLAKE